MTVFIYRHVSNILKNNVLFVENLVLKTPSTSLKIANFQTRKKHITRQLQREKPPKVLKVILPDDSEVQYLDDKLSLEEIRSQLKEKGVAPNKKWKAKPMYISCTNNIADPYVPPKGDGIVSFITKKKTKELSNDNIIKGKSYLAFKQIKNLDNEFDILTVAEKGKDLYIEAQKTLADKDEEKLHDLVTERAFAEMMESTRLRTIRWNYIQSLEPPRIVHIRCQEMISKSNIFAQVTLRLYSRQTLAVYDRFGRLIHGSEDTVKDVLEYVILEKHLTVPHGSWKIHGKIIPDWMPDIRI